MLHQEIKTYSLSERSVASPHFLIVRMEDVYKQFNTIRAVPHRHDYYNIYFVEKGSGTHAIDFTEYQVEDRQLYFVMPGQMHRLEFTLAPRGRILSFTEEFLVANSIPDYLINDIYLFNDFGQSPPLPIHEPSLPVYMNLISQIELFTATLEKYSMEAIGALVKLLLIQCNNHCSLHKTENPQFLETSNHLLRNFKQLLNRHFAETHKVNDYADRLAVTSDYLNKTVKSITGKSAKEHIQSKIVTEAKRYLIFSSLSNKELSYSLGFEEASHFNNFFKKNTGFTPIEFKSSVMKLSANIQ